MSAATKPLAGRVVTWRLWVGPLVWAAHFLAVYGFTALVCARRFEADALGAGAVVGFIGAATALAVALLGITIRLSVRDGRRNAAQPTLSRFVHWLAASVAVLSLLAVAWEALPVLFVPICS